MRPMETRCPIKIHVADVPPARLKYPAEIAHTFDNRHDLNYICRFPILIQYEIGAMNERLGTWPNFIARRADFRISPQPLDLRIKREEQTIGCILIVERDIAPDPLEIFPCPLRYDDISHARPWLPVPLWPQ